MNTIDEILEDLRRGKMAVIMDDEDRENEGDLIMAAGEKPARRARSHPASVCPARVSTPPGCAMSGKICPGWRRSSGRALGDTAVLIVCARSCADIPVVTPSAASMDSVKFVRCAPSVSLTMSGSRSCRQRSRVSVRQMSPRP